MSATANTDTRQSRRWQRRLYEKSALVAVRKLRSLALFWARQCRKSTTLGNIGFDEMTRQPGRRVIAASASLLVGSELIAKSLSAAEQASLVAREAAAVQAAMLQNLQESAGKLQFVAADLRTGKIFESLSGDDFTELYSTSRLEMRLYFDKTTYSRLQVIAPNPATARGWTGTVFVDEAGFIVQLAALLEAVDPIIDADPDFKMIWASNLPNDDRHPFFEMTLPPIGQDFPASPSGHFYRGYTGKMIHRVALADAYAAGHILYDSNSAKPLTLEQHFARAIDKGAWRRNYGLIHEFGGTAAIDLLCLDSAQRRGIGQCAFVFVDNAGDFENALNFLRDHLTDGKVGIGFDVATTTRETSNPSSVTVTESRGVEKFQRLVVIWKERKPQIARERLTRIIKTVASRPHGGPARRLAIDATSERYFAEETADLMRALIPVELVIASSSVEPPGYEEPTNMKTWLGDLYSGEVNDNHYALPPENYLKDDHRLVIKDRGIYVAEPQPDGKHGDTFDSGKLAQHALDNGGPIASEPVKLPGREEGRAIRAGKGALI